MIGSKTGKHSWPVSRLEAFLLCPNWANCLRRVCMANASSWWCTDSCPPPNALSAKLQSTRGSQNVCSVLHSRIKHCLALQQLNMCREPLQNQR